MIGARRVADAEIGAEKSGSEFPDKLLDRIGLVAEPLAELPIAAALNPAEMRQFVKQGRVVRFGRRARQGADENFAQRQMNLVGRAAIESAASAVIAPVPLASKKALLPYLQHSFWFLPNVAACYAMANLLAEKHNAFLETAADA